MSSNISQNIINKMKTMSINENNSDSDSDSGSDFIFDEDKSDYDEQNKEISYSILSIDIGVLHLGISVTLVDQYFNLLEVIWIDLINITDFNHYYGPKSKDCTLYHDKTFFDWISHVLQENFKFFEDSDFILIERQPPGGFVVVEQLLFGFFRHKSILISPNSMHAFFKIGPLGYEGRKDATEKICRQTIKDPQLLEQLTYFDREHDIADSICLMLFWVNKKYNLIQEENRRKNIMERNMFLTKSRQTMNIEEWFNCYKYKINI
jgi:hypothetical protein